MEAKKSEENGRDAMEKRATIVIKLVKLDRPSFAIVLSGGRNAEEFTIYPFRSCFLRFDLSQGTDLASPFSGIFSPFRSTRTKDEGKNAINGI